MRKNNNNNMYGMVLNISWFLNTLSYCITRYVSNSIYYNLHSSKEFFELRTNAGNTLVYLKNSYPFEMSFFIGDHGIYILYTILYIIMFLLIKKFFPKYLEGIKNIMIFINLHILLGFSNPLNKTVYKIYDPSNYVVFKMLCGFMVLSMFYQFYLGFFSCDGESKGDKRSAPPVFHKYLNI